VKGKATAGSSPSS